MKNARREIADALGNITQLGLNIAVSFLLWIFIATWVKKAFNLGNYIMIIGVLLGLGSAVLSFIKFCKQAISEEGKNEK